MSRPLLGLIGLLAAPSTALACGGFFCNQSVPIDQSKERIVFQVVDGPDDDGDGKPDPSVDVHVQVFYQGDAPRFAWVVPVPELPEVRLSATPLFTAITRATQPIFQLGNETRGTCLPEPSRQDTGWPAGDAGDAGAFDTFSSGGANGGGAPPGVQVLDAGQVGPFDYTTVKADTQDALLTWLADPDGDPDTDDAYTIPRDVAKQLGPYVAGGSYFVAFKLQSGTDSGDIAPIRLTYPGDVATIPLVLTSVAAQPDMRLEVYVLGDERAVPDNYLHVQINEAAVDWFAAGSNYDDVITRAANEAGGQAFATDYTGPVPSTSLRQTVWSTFGGPGGSGLTWPPDAEASPAEVLNALQDEGFALDLIALGSVRPYLTFDEATVSQYSPDGTLAQLWQCAGCVIGASMDGVVTSWDGPAAIATLEERVVEPLEQAEEMLAKAGTVTRMTSSMSSDEMTADPRFVLNADMTGEIATVRRATLVTDCGDSGTVARDVAPRFIELADGREVPVPSVDQVRDGAPQSGYLAIDGMPAALRIERTSSSGQPVDISNRSDDVDLLLQDLGTVFRPAAPADADPEVVEDAKVGSCGCQQGGAPVGLLALLALVGVVRRRR